jgi:hypothetical protein
MSKLEASRAALRGWVTREAQELYSVVSGKSNQTLETLKFRIGEFDKRLSHLDDIQLKIEGQRGLVVKVSDS